jgi:hypothetical protein
MPLRKLTGLAMSAPFSPGNARTSPGCTFSKALFNAIVAQ